MNWSVFLVLCLTIATASAEESRGINAKEGEFKYQAMLYSLYKPENPQCGGAIINEWFVLSSAACTNYYVGKLDKLVAYFGTISVYKKQQKREIAEIKIPREFDKSENHHDIALVRVTKKIEYSTNVQPINLPTNADVYEGTLVSSGFGIRNHPQHIMESIHRADNLHYHETSIVPMDQCQEIYEESRFYGYSKRNIGNDFICTKNVEGFTFDYGDIGNPLVANNVLYGIASWTAGPKEYPNVYTKVFSHKRWIEDNSKEAEIEN